MKIIIEAFALRNIRSGTGRYAIDMIKKMSEKHEIVVITRDPDPEAIRNIPPHVELINVNKYAYVPTIIYLYFFLGLYLRKFKCDFAIFLIGCRPLFYKNSYDLVICDFNHIIFPDSVAFITRQIYRFSSSSSIGKCRNLIAISKGTSTKSQKFYGRTADFIINPSLNKFKDLVPQTVDSLPDSFSLYVGAIEPRKNICNLMIAHEYAVDSGLISDKLLLVSSQSWFEGEVNTILSKMKHSKVISSIDESMLAWMYSKCERVYMTTYYEGYGMPAAEAQLFDANVICTDIEELREASKNNAIYVKTSAIDIYEGIAMSLIDKPIDQEKELISDLDNFETQIDKYISYIESDKK